jgi:predicted nucleotidyltransferase
MTKEILFNTNTQKVLGFLLSHPNEEFYDRQIADLSGISRSGTNFALRELAEAHLVHREKRGRMCFYSVDDQDSLIKQLKILHNIALLRSLMQKLEAMSLKIILYGSAALGENRADSDIDIFIQTREPKKAKKVLYRDPLREKIQYTVSTPNEFAKLKKENPVFHREISKGITLWEKK